MKKEILKLGWYQLVGGSVGVIVALYLICFLREISALTIAVNVLTLLCFAYSILCGIYCLKQKPNALMFSLINQILQFIGFAVWGFAFYYVAGIYLSIGLDMSKSTKLIFNFGLSKFDLSINSEPERVEISINLIALFFIIWIDKLVRKSKVENKNNSDSKIEL